MKESPIDKLRRLDREICMLSHIRAALEWDLETIMPAKAEEERAEELSYVSRLIHEKETSPEIAEAIEAAIPETDADNAIIRIRRRQLREEGALSPELVSALSYETGKAHGAWIAARDSNDWKAFQPSLERLVSLTKEKAAAIGGSAESAYDTMLGVYEEGLTVRTLDPVFAALETAIHRLMDELEGVSTDESFLYRGYDRKKLEAFCRRVITAMGFDWSRGTMGISAHPFTITLGRDDIRITDRFTDKGLFDPISSAMHEAGHALYDQHSSLVPGIRGTSAGRGASTGIHESQSRFWENMMGRSADFWAYMYPVLQEYIAELDGVSEEAFVKAINASHPSAIRVNADELTYSLHIIVRYEVEKAMFSGSVPFSELPGYWNSLSERIIRYRPASGSEGILQDCHWAGGDFGYFPSYAVGNIYAAQFLKAMEKDIGADTVREALRKGEYSVITGWQNRNIWSRGGLYEPGDLVRMVTGSGLDAGCYIDYLETRFRGLYL